MAAAVFFLLAEFLACPILQNSALAFTIQEEREYGRKMLTTIRREFPLINELDVNQYLNSLGQEVLNAAGSQYFTYHFYVINNDELNAFAAPSGLIFIHSGLIRKTDNENELMSVIAHEAGHIMARHIAGRSEQAPKLNAATLALVLAGMAVGAGPLSEALVMGGMATGQAMSLKYSRQDEAEADRKALDLMREMNRNPGDMLSMLQKMHRLYKIRMGNVPQYLLTHPIPKNRMNSVEDLINPFSSSKYKDVDRFSFDRNQVRVKVITGDSAKLEEEYRQILENSDSSHYEQVIAEYGLGLLFHKKGNYKEAISRLEEVMDFFPERAILWTDLGRVYLDSGDTDTALKLLEKSRSREPGNMYNNFYLARALERKEKFDRAETLYKQVMGHVEDYPPVYKRIAKLSARKDEEKGSSHYYLGLHYFYGGDFATSKLHLQKAGTRLDKDDPKQKEIEDILSRIREYRS
ncbi:MAG: M48 family metalloprotease, partial [Desulfurivibrionaceae bacterium]